MNKRIERNDMSALDSASIRATMNKRIERISGALMTACRKLNTQHRPDMDRRGAYRASVRFNWRMDGKRFRVDMVAFPGEFLTAAPFTIELRDVGMRGRVYGTVEVRVPLDGRMTDDERVALQRAAVDFRGHLLELLTINGAQGVEHVFMVNTKW